MKNKAWELPSRPHPGFKPLQEPQDSDVENTAEKSLTTTPTEAPTKTTHKESLMSNKKDHKGL